MKNIHSNKFIRKNSLITQVFICCLLLSSFGSSLIAQNKSDYVLSRIRALDRAEEERGAQKTNDTVPLMLANPKAIMTPAEKLDDLVAYYTSPSQGFKLIAVPALGTNNAAAYPLANVKYYEQGGSEVTDDYNYFTGDMDRYTGQTARNFKHLGNVAKKIGNAYQMTIFRYGETSAGYNLITDSYATTIERGQSWSGTGFTTDGIRYLTRFLPATGNRGDAYELILLSVPTPYGMNNGLSPEGVFETRMYPDDFAPVIYTEHKFHFTEGTKGSPVFFGYHVDSKFGQDDGVPVFHLTSRKGMYMEAIVPWPSGTKQRYSYSIPNLRGAQPIQYAADDYKTYFYRAFVTSDLSTSKTRFADTKAANPLSLAGTDAGMFFKDKGKTYEAGDVATFTLIQGVSSSALPELEFTGGYFDFELPKGEAFNMTINGLKWLDDNAGVGTDEDPKSLGGEVYFVKMNGAAEIASTKTFVGGYKRSGATIQGVLDYSNGGTNLIPADMLSTVGRHVFKFTITNKIQRGANIRPTTNVYIVTITVYNSVTTNVVYKDQLGNAITPPAGYTLTYSGRAGYPLQITYPQSFGNYTFVSTTPPLEPYTIVNGNVRTTSVFDEAHPTIFANYKSEKVPVTIAFRRQGDFNTKIYSNVDNGTTVDDVTIDVEPETDITTWVQKLITENKIKLEYAGYNTLEPGDYIVNSSNPKPITVPTQPLTIYYPFTGVRTSIK